MREAYLNGEWISESALKVSVWDVGFIQGVTISERMRTFRGQIFRLDEHLQRLWHSAEVVGLTQAVDLPKLAAAAQELATRHHQQLDPQDDVGVSLFVTPGRETTVDTGEPLGPIVAMHAYPLPFHTWHAKYQSGQRLVISRVQQVPTACWPAELKCRSRMHYYLADREARLQDPQARAILLDGEGMVIEASTANIVGYSANEGFFSPPRAKILPGVSVATLADLASQLGIPFVERDVQVDDLLAADELMLSSTSPCLVPVSTVGGQPLRSPCPGPGFQRVMRAWSDHVGVDIIAQATRFAHRSGAC